MHNLLVSYLLGEVSGEQRSLVEQRLRDDPQARRQLEHLRHCMGLDDQGAPIGNEPPADLAERTSERVASVADSGELDPDDATFSSLGFAANAANCAAPASNSNWTVADLTVATGVVLAIGMLLLPALRDSRSASRRLECSEHLRQLGFALASYSNDNQRYMPALQSEHVGIFALHLVDGGYIDRDTISHVLLCPSSELAEGIRADGIEFRIPTLEEFNASRGSERMLFVRTTGGSYAYRLGYFDDGVYRSLRNLYCPRTAVMADCPAANPLELNFANSTGNHGGCGENLLFQDLHVKYQVGFVTPDGEDHLYLNHRGAVAPSDDPFDTVLARSEVRPTILTRDKATKLRIQVVPFHAQ